MPRFLLIGALCIHLSCFAQIKPEKLDSLTQVLDSGARAVQSWQDSFQRSQDSIYRHYLDQTNSIKSAEKDKTTKAYGNGPAYLIAVILGGIVLFVVALAIRRKRNDGT